MTIFLPLNRCRIFLTVPACPIRLRLQHGRKLDALQRSAWQHEYSHSAGWLDRFLGPRECRLGSALVCHHVRHPTVVIGRHFVNFDNLALSGQNGDKQLGFVSFGVRTFVVHPIEESKISY